MAILDSQGRLFGKINILDAGAILVILLVLIGIFVYPGATGSVAQVGVQTQAVEIDVISKGVGTSHADAFIKDLQGTKTINLIIRNQPYGQVNLKSVQLLPRNTAVPQPDGSVKALKDPRPELDYSTDMMLTLGGEAKVTKDGYVLGNSKIKIGSLVEMEGLKFNFNGSVVDVRPQ
ncbi:pyruvate/2-oxoglutarate dehydrogenase complex,dihydrolipoamide dehydrogenase (E3) component [Leptolyngbya sp. 'hensonii']|nr:DUF4330 domain-containing protein [Leptolyngbya sp. 'hensonii']OLP20423.1 pyruvate/2-oxoglutarate dehydrogenase complex,dihydrolipoamide dehydrogenase (E3) component [Leptolyngbya sp. 'hensonii']